MSFDLRQAGHALVNQTPILKFAGDTVGAAGGGESLGRLLMIAAYRVCAGIAATTGVALGSIAGHRSRQLGYSSASTDIKARHRGMLLHSEQ